ncbi:alpha/beta hydrolase [Streptomyces sp. NPDC096934]|uniref:alpha/beta fold hydrolase n=1 Tax=Streptomyces sp. NPDC096934 TaxID=3155551 RepID=UPI0033337392
MSKFKNRRTGIWGAVAVGGTALTVALSGTAFGVSAQTQLAAQTSSSAPQPTVVLVHGAFADASGWNGVIQRLQSRGYKVVAPANPLRGLANDSAYIRSVLKTIDGPIVLAGHSYGGAVISEAAADNPNVKALVYVSAFMPKEGESLKGLGDMYSGSELNTALDPRPYDGSAGGGTDLYIKQDKFRSVFAADLPCDQANAMFAGQRPIDAVSFGETATKAAWETIPSWAIVAKQDKAIAPDLERFEAKRAKSRTVEINSSHVAMTSHPGVVADVVTEAARSVR